MKTITIRQLHERTGKLVREARVNPLIVTDRGERIAVLKRISAEDFPARSFPRRDAADLPSVAIDSTQIISDDRSER